jgi:hypothetical protein
MPCAYRQKARIPRDAFNLHAHHLELQATANTRRTVYLHGYGCSYALPSAVLRATRRSKNRALKYQLGGVAFKLLIEAKMKA